MTDQVEINKGHTQSNQQPQSIKIRNLKIRNFKGLDHPGYFNCSKLN